MKRFTAALFLTTTVLAFLPVPLVAQTPSRSQTATVPAAPQAGYSEALSAETIRERFNEVLSRYPRNVGRVLRLDSRLMQDPAYMASYPAIQQFIAQYPDVARNPEYYLAEYALNYEPERYGARDPRQQSLDLMRNWIEMVMVFFIVVAIASAVLWLIKAMVDHRRWLRVSKIQTEVHTKLLDRFSSNEELLAYIKTPAGSKFLESAPISVETASSKNVSAPVSRIVWSVQAGVVLLFAGLSLFIARNWTTFEEMRLMLAMMGLFGSFVGLGFIVSALASYMLSVRFGLFEGTRAGVSPSVSAGRIDSAGL
jgi:hypothetical protein